MGETCQTSQEKKKSVGTVSGDWLVAHIHTQKETYKDAKSVPNFKKSICYEVDELWES